MMVAVVIMITQYEDIADDDDVGQGVVVMVTVEWLGELVSK